MIFIKEYLWTILALAGFSLAGGFLVIPFRDKLRHLLFGSPLAGILFMAAGTSAIYTVLRLPLQTSAVLTFISGSTLTLTSLLTNKNDQLTPNKELLLFSAILIAFITYLTNYTTISLGSPGFLYMDGSDHLGYAHLADWLKNHLVSEQPVATVKIPYQSWPTLLFAIDPRFGSFFTLAIISVLRNQTAMFTYDFACAIVLSAGILAIAAIFARSRFTFILLSLGLLTSHWFDYSRSGYFGKILGYPSILFCLGLFLTASRPFALPAIACLVLLFSAASVMHSYLSALLFIVVIGGPYITFSIFYKTIAWQKTSWMNIRNDAILIGLLGFTVIATTGFLSRPAVLSGTNGMNMDLTWSNLFPRIFDLEGNGVLISNMTPNLLLAITSIMALIAIIFLTASLAKRNQITASLISGPLVLLSLLVMKGYQWPAYQLIGIIYPYFLCAAMWLIESLSPSLSTKKMLGKPEFNYSPILLTCLVVAISLHLPRLSGAIHRFSGSGVIPTQQFSKNDLNQLTHIIGHDKVIVDMKIVNLALPLLVELGHGDLDLEWSPQSWNTILAYRSDWPVPKVDEAVKLFIVSNDQPIKKNCSVKYKTAQYNLVDCAMNHSQPTLS